VRGILASSDSAQAQRTKLRSIETAWKPGPHVRADVGSKESEKAPLIEKFGEAIGDVTGFDCRSEAG
jgi:hypothetical protein